ncbi:MAG: hypothetical protein QF371_05945 [Flavobacteriales bacterium]|nr:hypothetical protein [Flavobacteriales bacterium]
MKFNGINVRISHKAIIGTNVRIGDNTVIYDNVRIGNDTVICNDCVIGEPTADYYSTRSYVNANTEIGSNGLIRSHTIIYAGASIGNKLETGHRVTIRESSLIGNSCKIGTLSDLQGFLEIGDHCQLHSNVHLCQYSELGNFVFLYPFAVLTNDKYPPSTKVVGPQIGNYTQVGVHSTIIGNLGLGQHCLIGACSTVTKSFEDYSFIAGSPAKLKSDVRELKSDAGNPLYPWKNRFSRGMPWEASDKSKG